jgi:hypothetical protein
MAEHLTLDASNHRNWSESIGVSALLTLFLYVSTTWFDIWLFVIKYLNTLFILAYSIKVASINYFY